MISLTRTSAQYQFYMDGYVWGAASTGITAPTGGAGGKLRFVNDDAASNVCSYAGIKILNSAQSAAVILTEWEEVSDLIGFGADA